MSTSKTKKLLTIGSVILLLLLAGIWVKRKTVAPRMSFSAAPLATVDGNITVSVNDYAGSVVIVSCFQTWCGDCAEETPILNELARRLQGAPFKVIYITDENTYKLARFRARIPSEQILFTTSATKLASFGVHVYPTTFLLDKDGHVVSSRLEGYDWLKEEARIRRLLQQ